MLVALYFMSRMALKNNNHNKKSKAIIKGKEEEEKSEGSDACEVDLVFLKSINFGSMTSYLI